ncbi:MAG: hypothetical protein U0P45_09805 [Acidimicrobiales bacterium]
MTDQGKATGAPLRASPAERVGCYPGSFDPFTVAHLAVAEAAVAAAALDRLDLVLSVDALGKGHLGPETVEARRRALDEVATGRPWLGVRVTTARLVADIAEGYDAVVMGADKWRQVIDPAWYGGDASARDAAVARLPRVLVAPRGDDAPVGVELLEVDPAHRHVSASDVRAGHDHAAGWRVLPGAGDEPEG